MYRLLAVLLLFISTLSAQAEVKIAPDCRVKNRPGGYCVWASIETIGKHYKDDRLNGLVDWYAQWQSIGADTKDVKECLDNLGVDYLVQENTTIEWLKNQVDNKIPIVVGCSWTNGNHAIIVVDLDDEWVRYIDSNDTKKQHSVNREWFDWAWRNSHRPNWSVKIFK